MAGTPDFRDITSGNNGYAAGTGYDLVTGIGTPVANLLVPALASYQATGTISGTIPGDGTVYIDANNNGVLDAGEVSAQADASGNFTLSGLPAGTYIVREAPQAGFFETSPQSGYYTVNVLPGQTVTGIDFANEALSSDQRRSGGRGPLGRQRHGGFLNRRPDQSQ